MHPYGICLLPRVFLEDVFRPVPSVSMGWARYAALASTARAATRTNRASRDGLLNPFHRLSPFGRRELSVSESSFELGLFGVAEAEVAPEYVLYFIVHIISPIRY